MKRTGVDLRVILVIVNILMAIGSVAAYLFYGENQYVDLTTIGLGLVLCLETHGVLQLEKKRRDPFLIVLAFVMIFFYSLRVITLTWFPYSVVFQRYEFGAADLNYGLLFIIVANLFLCAGLVVASRKYEREIIVAGWEPRSPKRVLGLLCFMIVFFYTNDAYWTADSVPRFFNFLRRILDVNVIISFAFLYLLLFRKTMSRWVFAAICAAIVAEGALHLLAGSRSVILVIVLNLMLTALAVYGRIVFPRKLVRVGIAGFPAIVVVLIISFSIATLIRQSRDAEGGVNLATAVRVASEWPASDLTDTDFEKLLPPLFDRIGYLDYASEIIAHRQKYESLTSVSTYLKSLIDNLLTPGFDIWDQPKVSNAMRFIYQDDGVPEKSRVSEAYQSDQLCLYGDMYGLLAYGSLPLFFLIGYGFKRVFTAISTVSPFKSGVIRLVVLMAFLMLLNSYGLDWVIIDVVILLASIPIWMFFFASRRTSNAEGVGLKASRPQVGQVSQPVQALERKP